MTFLIPAFLMNDRRLASSSSRPDGAPLSPLAHASYVPLGTSGLRSGTTRLIGMSLAMTFQVAREVKSAPFSHRSCADPRNAESSPSAVWRFGELGPR